MSHTSFVYSKDSSVRLIKTAKTALVLEIKIRRSQNHLQRGCSWWSNPIPQFIQLDKLIRILISKCVAKLLLKRWVVTDRASLSTSDCWDSDCAFRHCKLENANNVMKNVNFKKTRSRERIEMKNKQWPAPGKIGWVLYIFGWESYTKHWRIKLYEYTSKK